MTYREYMRGNELILSVAPTGYRELEDATEHLPSSPEEIAIAVTEASEHGAKIAHIHGRREDGSPSSSRLPVVAQAIREQTDDILIEYAVGPDEPLGDYLAAIDEKPHPEIVQVRVGPEQYGRRGVSASSRRDVDQFVTELNDRGIKPNLLVSNGRDLNEVFRLQRAGLLETSPLITLKMGANSGTIATPQSLFALLDAAPDNATIIVSATGPNQYPMTTMAIFYGVHVRVGMEDNLYLDRETPVRHNNQLVHRVVEVIEESQREFAALESAIEMLSLSTHSPNMTA